MPKKCPICSGALKDFKTSGGQPVPNKVTCPKNHLFTAKIDDATLNIELVVEACPENPALKGKAYTLRPEPCIFCEHNDVSHHNGISAAYDPQIKKCQNCYECGEV